MSSLYLNSFGGRTLPFEGAPNSKSTCSVRKFFLMLTLSLSTWSFVTCVSRWCKLYPLLIFRMCLIPFPQDNPLNTYNRCFCIFVGKWGPLMKLKDTILFWLAYHQVIINFLEVSLCSCFSFCVPWQHQEGPWFLCIPDCGKFSPAAYCQGRGGSSLKILVVFHNSILLNSF